MSPTCRTSDTQSNLYVDSFILDAETSVAARVETGTDTRADTRAETHAEIDVLDQTTIPPGAVVPGRFFQESQDFWDHPIPMLISDRSTYTGTGASLTREHPGMPSPRQRYVAPPLDFNHRQASSYCKTNPPPSTGDPAVTDQVVEICKILYQLNPSFNEDYSSISGWSIEEVREMEQLSVPRERRHRFKYECKDRSVAVIARSLLNAFTDMVSVFPVRMEFGLGEPSTRACCQYGLLITFQTGMRTILPLCIWMLGSVPFTHVTRKESRFNYDRYQ